MHSKLGIDLNNMISNPNLLKFLDERIDYLENAVEETDKSLTNILLLVSTGAYGLSINFFINQNKVINFVYLLKFSWLLLTVSIITNAAGYFLSRENTNDLMEKINDFKISNNKITGQEYNDLFLSNKSSLIVTSIHVLNFINFFSFIFGIILLTIFASYQI